MTAPTVGAVIAASPMPIRTCTPTIAVKTLPIGDVRRAADRVEPVKATAAAGTETSAATKEATVTERRGARQQPAPARGRVPYATTDRHHAHDE